jgi:hypothetical protein
MIKKILKISCLSAIFIASLFWLFSLTTYGQKTFSKFAEKTLSAALSTKVSVGRVSPFFPFFIRLYDVQIQKEETSLYIERLTTVPFLLDLPFNRLTLLSLACRGVELTGDPQKLLQPTSNAGISLSIFSLRVKSLHISKESFDGSIKGSLHISENLSRIKCSLSITRSTPFLWPKKIFFNLSKDGPSCSFSGTLFLGKELSPVFESSDRFKWNIKALLRKDTTQFSIESFDSIKGTWNLSCPTTQIEISKEYALNRMIQAKGTLSFEPLKEMSLNCADFSATVVCGKNIVSSDVDEGSGVLFTPFGKPFALKGALSLSCNSTPSDQKAIIHINLPNFSCNEFSGFLNGVVNVKADNDQSSLEISSNATGSLSSDIYKIPLQFAGDFVSKKGYTVISSDLIASPFHITHRFQNDVSISSIPSMWTSLRCQDLSFLQSFVPFDLSGAAELSYTRTKDSAHVSTHLSSASFGPISFGTLDASLESEGTFDKISASFDVLSGKYGYITADKAHSSCALDLKTLSLLIPDVRVIGSLYKLPLDITGNGEGKLGVISSELSLLDIRGTLGNEEVRLEHPFKLEFLSPKNLVNLNSTSNILSKASLSLKIGNHGRFSGLWSNPSSFQSTIEASWNDLSFQSMASLFGIENASGTIHGECHYQANPWETIGSIQTQASILRCGPIGTNTGNFSLSTSSSLKNSLLQTSVSISGNGIEEPVIFSGQCEVDKLDRTPFFTFSPSAKINGHLKGKTLLSKIFPHWMPEEIGCEGTLSLDVDIKGSLKDIQFFGPISLRDGRMELLATGEVLENIEMDGVFEKQTIQVHRVVASDTKKGVVSGTGSITLGNKKSPFSWEALLNCNEVEVISLPYASAIANGPVKLHGTANSLLISGNASTKNACIDVAARFPTNIPEIKIIFCDEPFVKKSSFTVLFDLYIEASEGAEIKGRGLNSLWRGKAHLTGSTKNLSLTGLMQCTKGSFTLAGKELSISEGSISFTGNIFTESRLTVVANISLPSITAQVSLRGSLKEPVFSLQATPQLPEKEILSLLLFNKEFSDISPLESLQLANAALTLDQSTGPFELIDHVKSTLGIDIIDVGSSSITSNQSQAWNTLGADSEETEGDLSSPQNDVTLKVGKYISDGVALTVSKDVTASVNRVGVEASITQNVSAKAEIGDDAGGIATIRWKKDY